MPGRGLIRSSKPYQGGLGVPDHPILKGDEIPVAWGLEGDLEFSLSDPHDHLSDLKISKFNHGFDALQKSLLLSVAFLRGRIRTLSCKTEKLGRRGVPWEGLEDLRKPRDRF